MMVFYFFLFLGVLGELGFILVFSIIFLYILLHFYMGLSLSINLTMDFLSFGMLQLSLLVLVSMMFAGYYEMNSNNSWNSVLFFLFLSLMILFFTFGFSSFLTFYLFFEFVVIPTFILILGWGYSLNRVQAAMYMFLYTLLSSLPLLVLLIFIYMDGVSLLFFYNLFLFNFKSFFFYWWFFLMIVFTVKLPLFILHLWLPKAHVDAPLLGSMILAGVLLKMGGYGIYKSMTFLFSSVSNLLYWFSSFSIWGGVLMAFLCLRQVDLKSLVAYSSVVHMGPVFCSLILMTYSGLLGAYWMMISHGFCSACLFYLVNEVYLVLGSRNTFFLRGGIFFSSFFSFIWFFFCLSNMGFPPTFNFFSEVLIMVGVFFYSYSLMALFFILFLLSGFYSIILYCFFNHGFEKFFLVNLRVLNLKNLVLVFIFFVFLLFFLFFMFYFC